jgi:hypothetical protein
MGFYSMVNQHLLVQAVMFLRPYSVLHYCGTLRVALVLLLQYVRCSGILKAVSIIGFTVFCDITKVLTIQISSAIANDWVHSSSAVHCETPLQNIMF